MYILSLQALHLENEEDQTEEDDNFNEEDAIKYYFTSGYNYDEILLYLEKTTTSK